MKRLFILTTFLLGISPICLNAQELTLEECQQQARAHYPLIKNGTVVNCIPNLNNLKTAKE